MKRSRKLSTTFVQSIRTPGRYGDGWGGFGLSLLVKASSTRGVTKSWSQRLQIDGRPRNIGLGGYPIVSLTRAREKALGNVQLVEQGGDPTNTKVKASPTFGECFEQAVAVKRPSWKSARTEQYLRSVMESHVLPRIGLKQVERILPKDVLAFLSPLALETPQVAKRAKIGLSITFKWAIAQGLRTDNPADKNIADALPKLTTKEHHRAVPFTAVKQAIATVRNTGAWAGTRLAFEFLVLTAARSGEVRNATWDEINLDTATWEIPALRMKSTRPHRVPLSRAALSVLDAAQQLPGGSGLIFPSVTGKVMSDNTLSKLLRENNVPGVVHGFRTSFRDWCANANIDRQVAESALAHKVGDAVETAYLRSDMLDLRRAAMESWAQYINRT